MQYQTQAVSKLYFVAAIGLFVAQVLFGLIIRGVSFEYRHQREDLSWKRRFDAMIVVGSAVPALLWGVTRLLAHRLRVMDEALADSVFLDVTGRTAKRLLELSEGADEFLLPITQEELAGMVGASRERVNKAIASFIRLGYIDQHERHYTILKRDAMELRAR